MKKILTAAILLLFTFLLAGCGNKKIEMVEYASVSLNDDGKELVFHITLDDVNMEPETPFQIRLFVYNGELAKALGKDLFVFDEEYVSHEEGEDSKIIEIKETLPLSRAFSEEEIREIVENEDKPLEIDVLNNEKVFATEVINDVQ